MSDSSRPHGLQPTRLLHPWDFPGKNTGVGCYCLLLLTRWGFGYQSYLPCCCSATQSCPPLCHPMDCSTPGFPVLQCLLEFAQVHVHWVNDAIQPSYPLPPPLLLLPSIFPNIRVFSSELPLCIRWPEYGSFSFSISPSNEYSGLISFRIDCFDPLAVQGTLKNHSSKVSVLWHSSFFMVQLSDPYMTTGKKVFILIWCLSW